MKAETVRIDVGTQIPEFRITVDPAAMKLMSLLQRDENPIHWDVTAVQNLGLGNRPINQGVINTGYIYQGLIGWLGNQRLIRKVSTTFRGNVFAGDKVTVGGRVVRIDDSGSGIRLVCEVWLDVENESRVVSAEAEVDLPPGWVVH